MARKTTRGGATKAKAKPIKKATTATIGGNFIKVSGRLMNQLQSAAEEAGFSNVSRYVLPHLQKLVSA